PVTSSHINIQMCDNEILKWSYKMSSSVTVYFILAQSQAHVGGVAIREPIAEATQPLLVVKRKGKAIVTEEQAAHSLLALHTPKRRSTTDQFIFQRRTPAIEASSTRPSAQAQDDTSANIVYDSPSPTDAETGTAFEKTDSGGETKILQIDEEKGNDVDDQVNLNEKIDELDQGQARSDPGRTPKSRPPPEQEVMDEDQAGPDPGERRRALAGPDLEPTYDKFMADLYPKVQEILKFLADEHVFLEDLTSSTWTLSSMKNLEDAYTIGDQFINEKSIEDEPTTESELAARVTLHEKKLSDLEQKNKTLDNMSQNLGSRVFTLELRDLPHKIDEAVSLYKAVEASMERAQRDEFLAEKDKSRKRRHDDQDPPSPPPESDLNVVHLQFQIKECHKMLTDQIDWANLEGDQVRIDVSKPLPLSGPPGHVTIQTQFFFNHNLDYLRYGSKGSGQALSISKMKAARYLNFGLELLIPEHMWINEVCTYDISASYSISHWLFNRHKFYIDRHIADSSHKVVRTHMCILSVVSIKAFSRYGYDYLKEITLRIADYQEYTIAEKDFKSLYHSNFEDLNLLHLQGYLNHLSGSNKCNNERKNMRFNEIYKFNDGLTNIMEALDFRVKEYKVNRLNADSEPEGSFKTWNALLVVAYEILTTVCFREPNEHFISAFSEDGNPARANIKQALSREQASKVTMMFIHWKIDTYTGNPIKEILPKIEST
nr:hypothetical protein [Tanacetum cinerariifolium]